ncbi:MAG: NRDE family protein [Bacteroidales bacterium]|nr:NRDE family protein [Bacteroidales bacterium]
MCLIYCSLNEHPKYQLIIAANRDEFYDRPALGAHWWDTPRILAGKDLKAGGTWLAVNRQGKFAALTNYRDPAEFNIQKKSRGNIVVDYFNTENESAFFENLLNSRTMYNGYNFIGFDQGKVHYYSNRLAAVTVLEKGSFALSNHLLDTDWPKVRKIKSGMTRLLTTTPLDTDAVFELLSDTSCAPDDQLPHTGVPMETERMLSSVFIQSEKYGTRSSNVILMDYSGRIEFEERTHIPEKSVVKFSI